MKVIKEVQTRQELYLEIPKGGVGAELGVCKGANAASLLVHTRPEKLYLVDIWTEKCPDGNDWHPLLLPSYGDHSELVSGIFFPEVENGTVEIRKEFSTDFLHSIPDNSLDWVYLDSDHHYEVVADEIRMSLKKVKNGGHIMGHDFHNFLNNTWGTSIIRAVNERIQSGDLLMEAICSERWSSYLTRVI